MSKAPWTTLRNLTDNPAWRPEVKAKISASRKGKPTTLGLPCPPEKRAKISAALMGKPTGRRPSPEIIAKFVEAGRANLAHGRGKDHPNWRGGLTPARQKDYQSPEYLAFVKAVLQRDNYTCQKCGARNGNGYHIELQINHKLSYGEHPDLRYKTDNGITLCLNCHNLTKSRRPKSVDFVPKERLCLVCRKPFYIFNPRKYCPDCRAKYCCPVCGSTTCHHSARRLYRTELPQLT